MDKPAVGFIGLGLMGSAMAERLQSLDYAMTVLGNRNRAGVEAAVSRGAREARTAKELAEASDIVMLCVATSEQVESRMRGPEGVIAGLRSGALAIDFGTSLPASTKALGAEVATAGGHMLDAPLGRTPMHAKDGLLNIMGAGDKDAFERAKPVLEDLGENVFHLGPLGSGHAVKLLNNFFGMTVSNAMAEVFAMADKVGVPRRSVYDAMSAGPLHSGMMDFVKAYAIDGNPDLLAFSVRNAAKDVGYYARMAEDAGAETVMGRCAETALRLAMEDGRGDDYVTRQVDFFAKRFGS